MGKWRWAYAQALKDVLRRPPVGQALDVREVADMILRLIGLGGVAAISALVQSYIPGVKGLYSWAFPVIMSVVYLAALTFHLAANYRIQLEKPKLFDVACATSFIGLPINRLEDGTFRASAVAIGPVSILVVHRGDLTNITHFVASHEIRFTHADKKGWATTNAIQVNAPHNPLAGPLARDFAWDTSNPYQWVLTGLPLTLARDEHLPIPTLLLSVADAEEAGKHFADGETCDLIIRLAIRTNKGVPLLPDQVISLTRSDFRDSAAYKQPMDYSQKETPKP